MPMQVRFATLVTWLPEQVIQKAESAARSADMAKEAAEVLGNTTKPYSLHQQQLAMLAQQQSLIMAAADKSGGLPKFSGNGQQPVPGGTTLPNQNWPTGYQIPGPMMPAGGTEELEKYL
ncbi:hypothetical protein L1987_69760 [Smallanthus sonchifolius]|uniref:Uncharacterized protein n=1 Tax=Smallanthus sonchifolius TaxID=185202 RepID=A0ACB9BB09_9ASTR|nr:hypothetical protein L1987_69760 [Smallanthus sonchifolius]